MIRKIYRNLKDQESTLSNSVADKRMRKKRRTVFHASFFIRPILETILRRGSQTLHAYARRAIRHSGLCNRRHILILSDRCRRPFLLQPEIAFCKKSQFIHCLIRDQNFFKAVGHNFPSRNPSTSIPDKLLGL